MNADVKRSEAVSHLEEERIWKEAPPLNEVLPDSPPLVPLPRPTEGLPAWTELAVHSLLLFGAAGMLAKRPYPELKLLPKPNESS